MRPRLQSWAYTVFLIASSVGQGFSYPSTSLSMLATSVLVLFRSLGTVMGVAVSSLVVQNSLVHYLDVFVKGSDKEEVRMPNFTYNIILTWLGHPHGAQIRLRYRQTLSAISTRRLVSTLMLPIKNDLNLLQSLLPTPPLCASHSFLQS
jgi:hypothetical protein